ncbi:unnamed protein product [Gongylonema pulchrum]|uniref:Phytoene/squalene synthase family protein n=1 Tax=Gongylonema pulchrum TaxID=637853 RepID=A0A183E234_9BILA|nr:unnamed protein product [Gongylonema pulchrum]
MDIAAAAPAYGDALLARWNDLASFLTPSQREKWWQRLWSSYSQRAFHNLEHLNRMLLLFDEYKDQLHERYATAYAIFFL